MMELPGLNVSPHRLRNANEHTWTFGAQYDMPDSPILCGCTVFSSMDSS